MKVRILGTAAGGGIPQWNCACPGCIHARRTGANRLQDTVAVSGDGEQWFLLNASADLRTQILATPELTPGPGPRDTPLRGVLLSTAELDHTIGLLSLRDATELTVLATETVIDALSTAFPLRALLGCYTRIQLHPLSTTDGVALPGGLEVRTLVVGAKRPRYAGGAAGEEWVSAFRITDTRSGAAFVYATCLPQWTDAFDAFIAGAAHVLLDGTFGTDDELTRTTGRPGSARSMGHLPVVQSRAASRRHPHTHFLFGHLNNTNPLAYDPCADVAGDGQWFVLR
jgi:pyrroloquinoline quinone biosynthesis protein B